MSRSQTNFFFKVISKFKTRIERKNIRIKNNRKFQEMVTFLIVFQAMKRVVKIHQEAQMFEDLPSS